MAEVIGLKDYTRMSVLEQKSICRDVCYAWWIIVTDVFCIYRSYWSVRAISAQEGTYNLPWSFKVLPGTVDCIFKVLLFGFFE